MIFASVASNYSPTKEASGTCITSNGVSVPRSPIFKRKVVTALTWDISWDPVCWHLGSKSGSIDWDFRVLPQPTSDQKSSQAAAWGTLSLISLCSSLVILDFQNRHFNDGIPNRDYFELCVNGQNSSILVSLSEICLARDCTCTVLLHFLKHPNPGLGAMRIPQDDTSVGSKLIVSVHLQGV